MHSFAMTENYIIFVEHPIAINVLQIIFSGFTRKSVMDCLQFYHDQKVSEKYVNNLIVIITIAIVIIEMIIIITIKVINHMLGSDE